VREALSSGAVGYVYKLRVASELLPAIETVLRGKQFVGGDLEGEFGKPTPKYPWQQAVTDASTESRPEHLPVKIGVAERAISARLRERALTPQENIAILEALTFSESLMPHKTETKELDDESEIA
jgi:DNA-binding NarL/FixJ family response regulator